jgi:hypothetical protein
MPMPLGQAFDAQKAVEAILHIATNVRDPTFHRVSKIFYFADKMHLAAHGSFIAGDDYVAMKHGPVPSGVYDLLKYVRGDGDQFACEAVDGAFAVEGKFIVRPLRAANYDYLSQSDVECLNAAIGKFGTLPFPVLTRLSHDAAWNAADENEFMEIEDIARASGGGDVVVSFVQARRAGQA